MKYENASGLLPEQLLREIQKYAAGKLLYVPYDDEKKSWGEISGVRQYLVKRNQMIINMFQHGTTITRLSDEFSLSVDTIKKIVYSKKNDKSEYQPTSNSAMEYANAGMLEEWIHTYLLFDRDNKGFSEGLRIAYRYYIGPLLMPLTLFQRSSGPEPEKKWQVNSEIFEQRVNKWIECLQNKKDVPPVIVNYWEGQFEINCNNPLLEAMMCFRKQEHYIIIWITEKSNYEQFVKEYGNYINSNVINS